MDVARARHRDAPLLKLVTAGGQLAEARVIVDARPETD